MVEINNQRIRRSSVCGWSGGTDNGRQKTRKSWLRRVIVGESAYLPITRSPSQTCHAKPKTQINSRRTLPAFPAGGMPIVSSSLERLLRKPDVAGTHNRLKNVAALPDD